MFIRLSGVFLDIFENKPKFKRNSPIFANLSENKAFSYEITVLPSDKNHDTLEYANFIGNYKKFKVYEAELLDDDFNILDNGLLLISEFGKKNGYSASFQSRQRLDWIYERKLCELDLIPFFAKSGEKRIAVQAADYTKVGAYSLLVNGKAYTSQNNTNFETKLESLALQIAFNVTETQVFAVYDSVRKKILLWRTDFETFKVKLLPNSENEPMLVFAAIRDNYTDSVNEFLSYANSTVEDTDSLLFYPQIEWVKETYYTHHFFNHFNKFNSATKQYYDDLTAFCGQFRLKPLLEHILANFGFSLQSKFFESDFGKYLVLNTSSANLHSYGTTSPKQLLIEPYINVEDKLPKKTLQEILDDLAVDFNLIVDFDISGKTLIIEQKTNFLQNLPIFEIGSENVLNDYSKSFEISKNIGYDYSSVPSFFSEQSKGKIFNYSGVGGSDKKSSDLTFCPITGSVSFPSLIFEDITNISLSVVPKFEDRLYAVSLAIPKTAYSSYDNGVMALCWSVTSPVFAEVSTEDGVQGVISGFEERGLYKIFYEKYHELYDFSYIVNRTVRIPAYMLRSLTNAIVRISEQNFLVKTLDYVFEKEYVEANLAMYVINFSSDKTVVHEGGTGGAGGTGSIDIPDGGGGVTPPEQIVEREIKINFIKDCNIFEREIKINFIEVSEVLPSNEREIKINFIKNCSIFERQIKINFIEVSEVLPSNEREIKINFIKNCTIFERQIKINFIEVSENSIFNVEIIEE